MILTWLVFLSLASWQCASAANILAFFPMPWKSHQFIFRPLVKELARRGHQVDFYTSMPMPDPPKGLTQFYVKDRQEEVLKIIPVSVVESSSVFKTMAIVSIISTMLLQRSIEDDKDVTELLRSTKKYDAVMTEFPVGLESNAYLAPKFNAVSIAVNGFGDFPWLNELAGLPDNPSYMASYMNDMPGHATFWQRLYNVYFSTMIVAGGYWHLYIQQEFADKYIRYEGWETRPKLLEMISETALYLVSSHVSSHHPYPKAPHVKEIGGTHIDPQPLPKDLQDFMDDAPHGVIYFSLGSILDPEKLLADGKFEIILNVFRSLKQKVMWKVAEGMPKVDDPRLRLQTWYPQQGILNHKNLVLFITHGGLQSTVEAIAAGVPCLGMPFAFDQQKDVAFLQSRGIGLELNFNNISATTLSWSINELLSNPKYKEAAKKQQALFQDRPRKPVEEAAYWIEYVIRHGNILRPQSASMPFYQVYLLDVAAVLIAGLITVLWVLRLTARFVLSLCGRSRKGTSTSSKKKTN